MSSNVVVGYTPWLVWLNVLLLKIGTGGAMRGIRGWSFAVVVLAVLPLAGCAAGKNEAKREEQQALVRELTARCDKGLQDDCARAAKENRILFEVYGCHCKDSMPAGHKEISSGG